MSLPCVRMRSTNCPAQLAELFFALGVPEQVLAAFADGHVGVHAAAVHAHHRLRQETGGQSHVGRDLAANQLVELDLIGCRHHFAVPVVDFKLRRRHFRMVLLILEAHGALHFGRGVDEGAQRVAGQRVIVSAGVDVFELAGFVVAPLRVRSRETGSLQSRWPRSGCSLLSCTASRHTVFSMPRMSAAYGVPPLSMTSPKTSTLPDPK